jgi:hypothetical protein
MVAFHRQAKPLGNEMLMQCGLLCLSNKKDECGCLLFKVNIVYTYMAGYQFLPIITSWNILCEIITRFFLFSPFLQAIFMQKDIINNAILLTFANDGYLLIGKTQGHEVNG